MNMIIPTITKSDADLANKSFTINERTGFFVENKGQWDDEVLFMANSKTLRIWITKKSMVFEQFESPVKNRKDISNKRKMINKVNSHIVKLDFINSSPTNFIKSIKGNLLNNFILGKDSSKYRYNVNQYKEILIENIYNNIDIKYYFDSNDFRYDFIVKPGANTDDIVININGSKTVSKMNDKISISTSLRDLSINKLKAFQFNKDDNIINVPIDFILNNKQIKFNIGNYDKEKVLIIDPIVKISDYFYSGEYSDDILCDLDVDSENGTIFIGHSNSPTFPNTFGDFKGSYDIILGNKNFIYPEHDWITFIGGAGNDYGNSVVTKLNRIYITGVTESPDYPLENEYYSSKDGNMSNYFTVLNFTGDYIYFSTYLGNSTENNYLASINVKNNGDVFLAGEAGTDQINPFYQYKNITTQSRTTNPNTQVGFVMGFSENSFPIYSLSFSTLFGGDTLTEIRDIDVDTSGNIYLTGITQSSGISFAPSVDTYDELNNLGEITNFLTKMHLGATNLLIDYNSFFGSLSSNAIAGSNAVLFVNDTLYIAGSMDNDGLPLKNAYDTTYSTTDYEAFIAGFVLNSSGANDLQYSSYFGGRHNSIINELDYDVFCGHLLFVGTTFDKLPDYYGHLWEPFSGDSITSNIMIGAVTIHEYENSTLQDLSYIGDSLALYGNTMRYVPQNRLIFVGGVADNTLDYDMALFSLEKSFCTALRCPCPESKSSWLTVIADKREGFCDSTDCFVTLNLDIHPFYKECYKFVEYSSSINSVIADSPILMPIDSIDLSNFDRCIKEGDVYKSTLKLFHSLSDENPCIITKQAYCRTTSILPCTPDFKNVAWINWPVKNVTLSGCSNCTANVTYVTREPNSFQDLQILKIELIGSGCDACDIEEIYEEVLSTIIYLNEMDFEPKDGGDCAYIERVSNGGCFGKWVYYSYGGQLTIDSITVWEICDSSFCCWQSLWVCRDENNEGITILPDDTVHNSGGNCVDQYVFNQYAQQLPCIFACNWNANLYGYYDFSNEQAKRNIEFEYTKLPNTYGIRVFNFDNLLKIQIRMNESNTVSIKTFDLIGNQVDNQIFNCHNGENELRVQTNLPTGVYIYTIEVNQNLIKSDKFLVQ